MAYTTGAKAISNFDSSQLKYNLDQADVFEAAKKETPWLTTIMKLSRLTTDASTFKSYANTPSWIDRVFYVRAAGTWSSSAVGATSDNLAVSSTQTGTAANVGWLVPGMTLRIKTATADTQAVISVVDTQQQLDLLSLTATPYSVADGDIVQVTGTAYGETSSAATAVNSGLTPVSHYCQDFENAWSMSGQAQAEVIFGPKEWFRLGAETMRTHKTDMNRGMLFNIGNDATSLSIGGETVSVRTTDGLVSVLEANTATLMNNAGVQQPSYASYTYNDFISDMEDLFALGSSAKIGIAGSSVLAFFSKIGSGSFLAGANVTVNNAETSFGLNITKILTPFGTLALFWDKCLRGAGAFRDYLVVADLEYVKFRPLVGNGFNYDTHVVMNTQTASQYRYRRDSVRTVAGLQVNTYPCHGLFKFQS